MSRGTSARASGSMYSSLTSSGPLVAGLLALLVYLPSVAGGFFYDDLHVVVNNRAIRDLGSLGTVLRADPARPLLSLTWALNYAMGGLAPWPYHLVNVIVHGGNAALAASLFAWMAWRVRRPYPGPSALLGACLFAVTPMAAETVAYVSSRSTALSSLLALASLRLAVAAIEGRSRRRHAVALALFVLALATKEEAASVPLFLLLLDFFFLAERRVSATIGRWRWHLPFVLLPVLGLIARRAVSGSWLPEPALPHGRYLATQVAAFPGYLLRALAPVDPAFYRNAPPSPWPPDAATMLLWLLAVALGAAIVAGFRRFPEWSFALLWLIAGLLPSSSLVPLKEMVVDHRAYLGSAGLYFAAGGLLWRPGRVALALLLLAGLGARSVHYQWILADPVRAWQDAVSRAPGSAEAHRALGDAYARTGDPRAEAPLRAAVELDPLDRRGWTNLGAWLAERGRLDEAAEAMRAAARAAPGDARIRDNLGMLLLALGREGEALVELEAAVAGRPVLAQPRITLAALLLRRGEKQRARGLIEEAKRLEVDPADARRLLQLERQLGAP